MAAVEKVRIYMVCVFHISRCCRAVESADSIRGQGGKDTIYGGSKAVNVFFSPSFFYIFSPPTFRGEGEKRKDVYADPSAPFSFPSCPHTPVPG